MDIIKAAIPASARREGPHPAKRTFQAIRIEVNDEINNFKKSIEEALELFKSDKYKTELEFTRKFIHKHGLGFALALAWGKRKN